MIFNVLFNCFVILLLPLHESENKDKDRCIVLHKQCDWKDLRMKIVFQISCLTLFQECQPIPVTGFQSTAGGDVLNFDELMHKDCRNSWKCKKNKITVRHEGVFLGCRKIQILSAADLQEVWVYSKAQARWNMLPKNYL